jgi:tellurite resistance protein TerC
VIEKSLSMDNIFIISLVFAHFRIPLRNQHRVLFWGIIGVVLLRGVMIGLGAVLIERFHAVLYVFGLCLLYTGAHMMFERPEHNDMNQNRLLLWLQKHIPVTRSLHGNRFFASEPDGSGRLIRRATPLLITLLFVELADVAFAVDSIPAVFGVTTDPFIVYTSNIFAVLGLRALYFALAAMLARFAYVKYSLSLILIFIGAKIFAPVAGIHISSGLSLGVTLALLAGGMFISLRKTGPAA